MHIIGPSTKRLAWGRSVVASSSKIDLLVLSSKAQAHAVAGVLAGNSRSNISATGHAITRDARSCEAALAAILGEAMGLCALLLADLVTVVLLLLGLLLLLKLATSFTNVLLAGGSVDLATRAEAETTHIKRAAEGRHSV